MQVYHQISGDTFEFGLQGCAVAVGGYVEQRARAEQCFTRHGCAFAAGFEFLDIDPVAGEGRRELADDSGSILAQEFEGSGGCMDWGRRRLGVNCDGEALVLQASQGFEELRFLVGWHFGAEETRKLSAQAGHPALEPVATVLGNRGGHSIHQARLIPSQ